MPISSRFVVNSTIILLTVGFIALLAIISATIWLGENAQRYSNEAALARDVRISAVELRSALQNAESSQRGFLVVEMKSIWRPITAPKRWRRPSLTG